MTENERLTEKRDGQNVIPLRQDGKTKWSLASAGMGDASTQFLYGTHADKLAGYEAIGTVEKIKEELDRLRNDNECQGLYFTLEERKALAKQSRELSEYKGIGTIEEFKVLKNTDIPIIHGKAELDLNDNEVRNKAIDEFVIKLKRVRGYGLITNFDRPFGVTFNKLDEIAEQLKGGATWLLEVRIKKQLETLI